MVKLYTNMKYVTGDLITDNEAFFDRFISAKNIDIEDRKYLKQIDGATIIDAELGTITTPFGASILENISTGAKTVMNLLYLQKNNKPVTLDITECGANALDAIFSLMDNYNGAVKVLLCHAETSRCGNHDYCVNDEHIVHDAIGLSIKIMEAVR